MKSLKINTNNRTLLLLLALLILTVVTGYSQNCTGNQIAIKIQNINNPNAKTLEFDVYVTNVGSTSLSLAAIQGSLLYDNQLIPNNAATSLTVIEDPNGKFNQFNTLITRHTKESNQLRWTQSPVSLSSGKTVNLPQNQSIKFARFRLTSSLPLQTELSANLVPQNKTQRGLTKMLATVYCNGNQNSIGLAPRNAEENLDNSSFVVVGNPNPFRNSFLINVKSASENPIQYKVYNMIGRLIDSKNVDLSQLETFEIGSNYAAGIYNIIVAQDNNSQTIRMIKQ